MLAALPEESAEPEVVVVDQAKAIETMDTIRVPSARLDSLVDLVGEMVTVQARLSGAVADKDNTALSAVSEAIERTCRHRGVAAAILARA